MATYKTDSACAVSDMNRLGPRLHMLLTNIEKLQEYADECSSKLSPILRQISEETTSSTTAIMGICKNAEPECEIFGIIDTLDYKIEQLSQHITKLTNRCML